MPINGAFRNNADTEASVVNAGSDIRLTDGIDLPPETTLDDLKTAMANSRTILEVQRTLGIDRTWTR